jgi:NTE family protein
LAYCGALLARGVDVSAVDGSVGTSAGALFALAVCLGLTPERLCALLFRVDWVRVHAGLNVHSAIERFGLETRAGLEYMVGLILAEAGVSADITLGAAHALTKRHFACCITDLTHRQARYLDHTTAPNVSVVNAVVASMCIPVLFEPVSLDGALCVDGGLMDNVPLRLFALEDTVVFRLDPTPTESIGGWRDYVSAILDCAFAAQLEGETARLEHARESISIRVPSHLPSSLEMHKVTPQLARTLVTVGYIQASPQARELMIVAGTAVQLVCTIHQGAEAP